VPSALFTINSPNLQRFSSNGAVIVNWAVSDPLAPHMLLVIAHGEHFKEYPVRLRPSCQ
jgi:hypothetical protein